MNMMEELWKNSAIIAKRNVDSNQTPISVSLTELKQIIDVHSCIVLNQLPDENYGINIADFTEVYDIEEITTRTYKTDYANGVVYFHPNNIGKMLQINYSGIGYTLLSASRIYTKYDKYNNVIETLEELIDKGKLYIQAIDALGGAVEVINRVESANATGTILHENLNNDIEIGIPLDASLRVNIQDGGTLLPKLAEANNIATQKKTALDVSIESATNTNTTLSNTNQSATQTNLTLQQAIASGQDSVNKINATGNKSLIVGSSQFVNNQYTWTHSMNNDNLIVNFMDSTTNEPLMPDYKILDKNNILIRNSAEHPNIKVVLSASYYQGNALFGTNVEEFASDSITAGAKKVRLKDGNGVVENPITDSDAVFMADGKTKLTKKISDIDTSLVAFSEVRDELEEARGTSQFLGDRLDYIDASLAEFTNFKANGGSVGGSITMTNGNKLKEDNYHVSYALVDGGDRVVVDIGNAGNAYGTYLVSLEINHNPRGSYFYWSSCNMLLTHEVVYDGSRLVQRLSYTFLSEGSADFKGVTYFLWATTQVKDKALNAIGSGHMHIIKPLGVSVAEFVRSLNIIKLSVL